VATDDDAVIEFIRKATMTRHILSGIVVALSALTWPGEAAAQAYPNRPITIIVPFAAGGPTDIVARVIAAQFSNSLGQQAVVENVVGAAGTIGMVRAARSAPDGYTLLLAGMSTMSFSPTVYPNIQAHAINSFEPVGIVASAPIVLIVGKQVPANTVKEFAAHLQAQGDKAANGHAGVGSSSHLACALVNSRLGAKPSVVPYKGTSLAINDMLAGQIHYVCDQTTSVMTQVQAGGVKALAVLAEQRSPALPDVPTIAEAGYPGTEMVLWNAIFAPKGTLPEIVKQLNAAIAKGVEAPAARKQFSELGAEAPSPGQASPEELAKIHAADVEKWGKVIRDAGIQVN
jgi:tripartite-type tricarboxylate transporter receptor subunit TctC